jgi:hypothetical protein
VCGRWLMAHYPWSSAGAAGLALGAGGWDDGAGGRASGAVSYQQPHVLWARVNAEAEMWGGFSGMHWIA